MALLAVGLVLVAVVALVLRARRRKRAAKPTREASACVVLEQNAWDACAVDDVREPWSRYTTEPVRGFCGVAPGRHRIVTTSRAGDATIDFVAYPGEVLAWRLDADRARWEPHDLDGDTRAMLEGAPPSTTDLAWASVPPRPKLPGWLVHLRTTIGMASSRDVTKNDRRESGEGIDRIAKRFAKLVARAAASDVEDDLEAARALGESLLGRALTRKQIHALVAPAREAADKLASAGDHDRAMRVVALGLALMPGHPELMVAAGCTLAARGEVDEAARALDAALERDRCLDAEDVARAMRARLDLKSRLGRSVRV
ncbi:MAG TPA: hypothetical protein VIF62_30740 [Labilithrix sp.]